MVRGTRARSPRSGTTAAALAGPVRLFGSRNGLCLGRLDEFHLASDEVHMCPMKVSYGQNLSKIKMVALASNLGVFFPGKIRMQIQFLRPQVADPVDWPVAKSRHGYDFE